MGVVNFIKKYLKDDIINTDYDFDDLNIPEAEIIVEKSMIEWNRKHFWWVNDALIFAYLPYDETIEFLLGLWTNILLLKKLWMKKIK